MHNYAWLGKKITVLGEKGYLIPLKVMGNDQEVVDSARVSYYGVEGYEEKQKKSREYLIRHCLRHGHTSPFEQCRIQFAASVPLDIEAQWYKHRTSKFVSKNQLSARYAAFEPSYYTPDISRMVKNDILNKQCGGEPFSDEEQNALHVDMEKYLKQASDNYQEMLNRGLSREVARCLMPSAYFTIKVVSMDVSNLMHFIRLRDSPHAQPEIQVYAAALADILKKWMPVTFKAYEDFTKNSVTFSGPEVQALKRKLKRFHGLDSEDTLTHTTDEFLSSKSEKREFGEKLTKIMNKQSIYKEMVLKQSKDNIKKSFQIFDTLGKGK